LSSMTLYEPSVVNQMTDEFTIGVEELRPILIMLFFCLVLGAFAFLNIMREWAWLNQWNPDEDDFDHDIENVASQ